MHFYLELSVKHATVPACLNVFFD